MVSNVDHPRNSTILSPENTSQIWCENRQQKDLLYQTMTETVLEISYHTKVTKVFGGLRMILYSSPV